MSLSEPTPPQSIETGHHDVIHDAQLDYYGKRLATASSDRTIKITDISEQPSYTNTNAVVLEGHQGPVWQVAWAHPKYGSILASSSYDGKVLIWKQSSGNGSNWTRIKDHTLHTSSVNSISWAPHELGPTLACASSDGNVSVLTFHNDGTWEASILAAHKLGVSSVSWAPATTNAAGGLTSRLVTGGCDSLIKIWSFNPESKQWQCDETIATHSDWVRDVAWSPNVGLSKQYIASASQDKSVYMHTQQDNNGVWTSTKLAHDFKDTVWRLSWSLSGNVLAASAGDGKVTLWKENLENVFEMLTYQHLSDDAICFSRLYHDEKRNDSVDDGFSCRDSAGIVGDWWDSKLKANDERSYKTTIAMPDDNVHLVNVKNSGDLSTPMQSRAKKLETELSSVQTHTDVLNGDAAAALIEYANTHKPDLVIIGRRKLGHWQRLTTEQGFSLSAHLATHIQSPVIVVKFCRN